MEYSRIVAVTGMPGLYEILSSKTDGAIVRSLTDETTKFVSSRVHNLSHLESIEIYTTGDNASLGDVLTAMKSSSEAVPDVKDSKALKAYFEKIFPQIDTERVYASDMKKMVTWFTVLEKHTIDYTQKEEAVEETEEAEAALAEVETASEAPTKKAKNVKKEVTETAVEDNTEIIPDDSTEKKTAKPKKKKTGE